MSVANIRRTIRRKWYSQSRGRLIAFCMLAVLLYCATIDRLAPCPPQTTMRAKAAPSVAQEAVRAGAAVPVAVTPIPLAATVRLDTSIPYAAIFEREAARVDIPPKIIARWAWWESAMNPRAVSRDGYASRGIGQFIRSTWAENAAKYGYSWDDAFDPEKNIRVMADYMSYCRAYVAQPGMSEADIVRLMLACYNRGPGGAVKYGTSGLPARSLQAIADTLAYSGY